MALDTSVYFQGGGAAAGVPNVMAALQSGIQANQAIRQAPLMQKLLEQRAQSGQQAIGQQSVSSGQQVAQFDQAQKAKAGSFIHQLTSQMKGQTPEQRVATVAQNAEFIQSLGQDPSKVDVSDEGINRLNQATSVFANQADPDLALKSRTLDIREAENQQRRELLENEAGRKGDIARQQTIAKFEEETRFAPNLEKQKSLAKDSAKLSTEIFTRVDGIDQNIANMREGIKLIDSGANVGPINKWLPSFKESTVKLENLKNRLGLDVIASVTFGALSAKELETAFDTAVPAKLKGEALKSWFTERIDKQEKLRSSLESAGIFLSEDGATIPKLMAKRSQERKQAQQAPATPQASVQDDTALFSKYGIE